MALFVFHLLSDVLLKERPCSEAGLGLGKGNDHLNALLT